MLIRNRTRSGLRQLIALHTQSFSISRAKRTKLNMISKIRMERVWEYYERLKVLFEFNLSYFKDV